MPVEEADARFLMQRQQSEYTEIVVGLLFFVVVAHYLMVQFTHLINIG